MENLKDPRPAKIKPAISVRLEQHGKQDQWLLFPDFQRQPRKEQFPRPVEAQPSRPVAATGAEYVCHQPWWLSVGAVRHVWSPAEVCEFITLTGSDPPNPNYRPKPQNCLQSEASCSRPSQAPIPLNQDLGDGPGTLQQGARSFFQLCKTPRQPPSNFPARVVLRRFCAWQARVWRRTEQELQQQNAKLRTLEGRQPRLHPKRSPASSALTSPSLPRSAPPITRRLNLWALGVCVTSKELPLRADPLPSCIPPLNPNSKWDFQTLKTFKETASLGGQPGVPFSPELLGSPGWWWDATDGYRL